MEATELQNNTFRHHWLGPPPFFSTTTPAYALYSISTGEMGSPLHTSDGALPFSDVTGLLAAAAAAEKQQALTARIYLPPSSDPTTSTSVDQFAQLSSLAKQLRRFVQQHTQSSDDLNGQDYIWHREPPSISVVRPPRSPGASTSPSWTEQPPYIQFHLRTGGECIEDEWFATHLLLRASTQFAQHRLCISVEDEDGQFLLIEAADHLPDWIAPEAVTNRVWIFDGHLHLIPPYHKSIDDGSLSVPHGIALVTDQQTLTRASDDVEAAAFARAYDFPSAAMHHHHCTLAYLPRCVAQVLTANPQLIASCVNSIQSRDFVSSRSGSKLVRFPPPTQASSATAVNDASDPNDDQQIVLTRVKMTRHLYAQLLYDRFFPPRQLGREWQNAVEKYRVRNHRRPSVPPSGPKIEEEEEVQTEMLQGRWRDLGAKIWCGLEMAYTESLPRRKQSQARPMTTTGIAIPSQEGERLISSLSKLGYFQGELEGSAKWRQLQSEALAEYQKSSTGALRDSNGDTADVLICDAVDRILERKGNASRGLQVLPPDAAPADLQEEEDDDSWLQLDPSDVESILQARSGEAKEGARAVDEQDAFQRLGAFNSKMADFIKTKSDVQGALFQDELNADDMLLDDDDLLFEDLDEEEQEQRIRKEVEERMRSGGESEKRKLIERLLPRMSEHEWTQKPSNAQDGSNGSAELRGGKDFVSSIDRIAAERDAQKPQKNETGTQIATRGDNNLSAAHTELRRRLASQYMRDTSSLLSSQGHQRYDGASDSDDEELEQETSPEVRRQRAMEFDLEPDEQLAAEARTGEEAEWEDVGEPEVLDEELELDNLLEFARISLGLTKEQYHGILEERKSKGRFVPNRSKGAKEDPPSQAEVAEAPKLDTFEGVLAAMETELHHLRSSASKPTTSPLQAAPLPAAQPADDGQDEELLAHLVRSGSDVPASLLSHLGQEHEARGQAEQIEGFLRSFQAQTATSGPGAGSGPVEVLMHRFGLGSLPADQDPPSHQG